LTPLPIIVLYGGSFDPVHNAHIVTIRNVIEQLHPQSVWVIPCHIPPHKAPLSVEHRHRLAMLKLALEKLSGVEIDERELTRDKISYTYDTVCEIRRELSRRVSLNFVIGWDSWLNFTGWYRWREILNVVNLVVVARPNVEQQATLKESHQCLQSYCKGHQVLSDQIGSFSHGKIVMLPAKEIELASQLIRDKVARHQNIREMVPSKVADYIEKKRLYTR